MLTKLIEELALVTRMLPPIIFTCRVCSANTKKSSAVWKYCN